MITVLLAVYNGEKYLKEQIESILNQSVKDIKIVIRDDGSTDNSGEIIAAYCSEYPHKVSCIKGDATGSASKNFAELFKKCDSEYDVKHGTPTLWLKFLNSKNIILWNIIHLVYQFFVVV